METVARSAHPAPTSAAAFYESRTAIQWIRRGLRGVHGVSPELAARAAALLFRTPLPSKFVARRIEVPAGFEVEQWPFESASITLYRPAAPPPGAPVVLLSHGWGGHGLQWTALARRLVTEGFAPIMVDQPGHGRSRGWRSSLPQFARALDYVAQHLAPKVVVGHSLGATAAAYAVTRGLRAERVVLVAPAGSPLTYTRGFATVFGLSERARAAMQHLIEAAEGTLMSQFEAEALAPRLAAPVLVVHDAGDRINPVADGQAYAAARDSRLVITAGLGHRRILADPAVLDQIAGFVAAR